MSNNCGSTNADGYAVCIPATPGQTNGCGCSPKAAKNSHPIIQEESKPMWKKIRSIVMLAVACVASPCCTPLIVPLLLALLAGTPLALWLTANIGWVYGLLTLVSMVSLVMGLRWMNQKVESNRAERAILTEK